MSVDCTCSIGTTSEMPDAGIDPWCPVHGDASLPSDLVMLAAAETDPDKIAWFKSLFPSAQEFDIPEDLDD